MHVAVAIVTFRNPADVVTCLAALDKSTHRHFEVIICENGDAAAFKALVALLPTQLPGGQPVRAVSAPDNPGFAGGVNICLAETPDADAWWVLNPDTEPHPEAMSALVARLAQGDCDMAGGVLLASRGVVQALGGRWRSWLGRAVSIGVGTPTTAPIDADAVAREMNYVLGASMLVSSRYLAAIGPMREDYFLYCEEIEWCVRGQLRGLHIGFAPDAVVTHHQGTTTGGGGAFKTRSRLTVYLSSRNMVLMTRDLYPWRVPTAALGSLASALLVFGRRGAWAQARWQVSGTIAGLLGERGVPGWMRKRG